MSKTRTPEQRKNVQEFAKWLLMREDAIENETRLAEELVDLLKFKNWVHEYLTNHGVPENPPGSHGAAGCRIGDRMDWLMTKLDAGTPTQTLADDVVKSIEDLIHHLSTGGGAGTDGRRHNLCCSLVRLVSQQPTNDEGRVRS